MASMPLDREGDEAACELARVIVARLAEPFAPSAGDMGIGASVGVAVWPDDTDAARDAAA